jgi:AcrR family transcriptional regulator
MSVMPDRSGRLPRQERRAQLLEAARDAFVQQGYHAAGMDDIAELAGVSKPVLYQHFPGKLELYLAVLDESSDSLITLVRQALDSTHDNRKRVRATFVAYFDFVAHESGSFRLIFESDLTNVPAVSSRVARTNETCAEMIAEVIREDTELDDETSMLLASGLLGMAQTSARRWLHSPSQISQAEAARAMAALAWRGISGFPLTGSQTGSIPAAPGATAEQATDAAASTAQDAGTSPAVAPAARSNAASRASAASTGASATTPPAARAPRKTAPARATAPKPRTTATSPAAATTTRTPAK